MQDFGIMFFTMLGDRAAQYRRRLVWSGFKFVAEIHCVALFRHSDDFSNKSKPQGMLFGDCPVAASPTVVKNHCSRACPPLKDRKSAAETRLTLIERIDVASNISIYRRSNEEGTILKTLS